MHSNDTLASKAFKGPNDKKGNSSETLISHENALDTYSIGQRTGKVPNGQQQRRNGIFSLRKTNKAFLKENQRLPEREK